MKLKPIIDRLKDKTTLLQGRIAGASQYAAEVEAARMALPCAFVVRGQVYTGPSAAIGNVAFDEGVIVQLLTEEFGIAVSVDNSADGRGQASEELLDDIRHELWVALLGWIPDDRYNAFEYVGETPLELNRARVWRLFVFSTSAALDSLDTI